MPYPDNAAKGILDEVWKDRGFPVDPVWIARQLGIEVVEADLPSNISGALIKESDKDPIIFLSSADSKSRKRFSCAHEIGHYAQRMTKDEKNYKYVDLRSPSSANGTDPEEIFANQFAANLLMPKDEVIRMHKDGIHASVIAAKLGVSDDAIRFRLKNLTLC